jgi:hypothetical protein
VKSMPEKKEWNAENILKHIVGDNPELQSLIANSDEHQGRNMLNPSFMLSLSFSAMVASNVALHALRLKNIISEEELERLIEEVRDKIAREFGLDVGFTNL